VTDGISFAPVRVQAKGVLWFAAAEGSKEVQHRRQCAERLLGLAREVLAPVLGPLHVFSHRVHLLSCLPQRHL